MMTERNASACGVRRCSKSLTHWCLCTDKNLEHFWRGSVLWRAEAVETKPSLAAKKEARPDKGASGFVNKVGRYLTEEIAKLSKVDLL